MECPKCGADVRDDASYCPDCGLDLDELRERAKERQSSDDGGQTGAADQTGGAGGHATGGTSGRSGSASTRTGGDGRNGRRQSGTRQSAQSGTRQSAQAGGQQARGGGGGTLDSLPLAEGAVVGALAYVLNFAAAYLFVSSESSLDFGSQSAVGALEYAGWMLYGGHNVKLSSQGETANFLENAYSGTTSLSIPKLAYYVVPLLVLAGAGYYVAQNAAPRGGYRSPSESAKAGATIATGYVALAVGGAVTILSVTPSGFGQTMTTSPETGSTVLFFAAYALVAGGIGGYLAGQ